MVLTSLGRFGSPVIRYRTGDVVRLRFPNGGTQRSVLLEGGILGRADDMLIVRGVNIFPSSVEQILRAFSGGLLSSARRSPRCSADHRVKGVRRRCRPRTSCDPVPARKTGRSYR